MKHRLPGMIAVSLTALACYPGGDSAREEAAASSDAAQSEAASSRDRTVRLAAMPDVTLRFQIIEADGFTGSDSAIAAVESALRDLFRFRGYRLATETLIRSSAPGRIQQRMVADDGTQYLIEGDVGAIHSGAGGRSSADLELRLWVDNSEALVTSVNIPSGQTVVVGTSRTKADRPALILVVRPEIGF